MDSFEDLRKLFDINIESLMDEVIKESRVQESMIDLNQEQLQSGIDALGQTIVTIGGSPYRPMTVVIKRAKGQPTNKVTLYDTGKFYDTFRVRFVQDGYEITANFQKGSESILDNFSSQYDFTGLTDETLAEFVYEIFLPRFQRLLLKKLGLI